jgi:hypothetical protein
MIIEETALLHRRYSGISESAHTKKASWYLDDAYRKLQSENYIGVFLGLVHTGAGKTVSRCHARRGRPREPEELPPTGTYQLPLPSQPSDGKVTGKGK